LVHWALGSSVPGGSTYVFTKVVFLSCTSAPPRRLHLKRSAFLRASYVDRKPRSKSTSLRLSGPTAYPEPGILFFAPLSRPRPEDFALPTGSHALGFGYPHSVSLIPSPLEASFSLQRSWASPFRAFLLPGDRGRVSPSLSAPALFHKTPSALYRRFSGLIPPGKPSPFVPPGGLARVGGSCSHGLSDLSGSPAADPSRKSSTPPGIPFHPSDPTSLRKPNPQVLGFLCQRPGCLPPKRAPARLAFLTNCRLQPFEEMSRMRTIFSSRGSRIPRGFRGAPLCNRLPPA